MTSFQPLFITVANCSIKLLASIVLIFVALVLAPKKSLSHIRLDVVLYSPRMPLKSVASASSGKSTITLPKVLDYDKSVVLLPTTSGRRALVTALPGVPNVFHSGYADINDARRPNSGVGVARLVVAHGSNWVSGMSGLNTHPLVTYENLLSKVLEP